MPQFSFPTLISSVFRFREGGRGFKYDRERAGWIDYSMIFVLRYATHLVSLFNAE